MRAPVSLRICTKRYLSSPCDVAFTAKWVVKSKALSLRGERTERTTIYSSSRKMYLFALTSLECAPQKGYFIAGNAPHLFIQLKFQLSRGAAVASLLNLTSASLHSEP
jgi:hypothetical protein